MKKAKFLILSALAVVMFVLNNANAQQARTTLQPTNKYFDWQKSVVPDSIPYEKIMDYVSALDVYRPMYHDDVFLIMKGLDEGQQFIFHLVSKNAGKNRVEWRKLKIPMDMAYEVIGFNLISSPSDGKESYQIVCQSTYRKDKGGVFTFDLDSGTLQKEK